MNYKKIYDQLVEKCRVRGLDKSALKGYYEKHHIVPRCMGGSDDVENFVLFTAREHFIAHMLLWKIHPSNGDLALAVHLMLHVNKSAVLRNSKLYEHLKMDRSLAMSREKNAGFKDLTGNRYSRLVVIGLDYWQKQADGRHLSKWLCQCDCGKEASVVGGSLRAGLTTSCGCYKAERTAERSRKYPFDSRILQIWKNMMGRCYNEKDHSFASVGAKGIIVCEEWFDKQIFADFIGELPNGMIFGRLDFSKDFEPSNCKFMTRTEYLGRFPKLSTNSTGRTGVYLDKKTGMWYAQMTYGNKTKRLCTANLSFEEAVKVREVAELAHFGKIKE